MKKLLFILLMVLLIQPAAMRAQETLTVADGGATNTCVPIEGLWCDSYVRNQTIYPSTMLTDMAGGTIESMTFYLMSPPGNIWSSNFVVKLGETTASSMSLSWDATSTEEVYTGTMSVSGNTMTIVFSTPYFYSGGNLLLDIYSTTTGNWSSANFMGVESPSATLQGHGSSASSITAYINDFVPKTTFAYTSSAITCPMPSTLAISNVTDQSATVEWNAGGSETLWDMYVTTNENDVPDETTTPTESVTINSYLMSGLESSTTYYVYVRANCGGSDGVSRWRRGAFLTTQVLATLPYEQDWESDDENANWFLGGGSGINQWAIGTAVAEAPEMNTSLYVSNDYGTTNAYSVNSTSTSWAYRDINFGNYAEYNLSFDWINQASQYGSDYLMVYLGSPAVPSSSASSSGATPAGATLLGTFYGKLTWQHVSFNLTSEFAGNQRLYFLWYNAGFGGENPPAVIDNIRIIGTDCTMPDAVVFDNTTVNSYTFHFVPSSPDHDTWEAMIYSATDTLVTIINDTTYTFEDLNSDMMYYVQLRTVCDDEEFSNWTTAISGRTACAPAIAPYTEDFTDFNINPSPCWGKYFGLASSIFAGTSSLSPVTDPWSGWSFSNSYMFPIGHPSIYIPSWSSTNYWLVSPEIDLGALSAPALSFNLAMARAYSSDPVTYTDNDNDDKFMVIISTDGGLTWSESNATVWSSETTADYPYKSINNVPVDVQIPLMDYVGETIRVAFYQESTIYDTYSSSSMDLHIANVKVDEYVSCLRPNQVTVASLTSDQIDLTWTPVGEATEWDVLCVPAGTEVDEETAPWTLVQDTMYSFTELSANTSYDIYVRANCGTSYSNSRIVTVHTDCSIISELPYTDNFDSAPSEYVLPYCWYRTPGSYGDYPYTYSYNPYSGRYSLSFYTYAEYGTVNTIAATSEFAESIDINTLLVTFMYRGDYSTDQLTVGVMTNPTDESTFVPVQTISVDPNTYSEWTEYEVDMSSYTGTGKYIAFKNSATAAAFYGMSTGGYIDNLMVQSLPSCHRPSNIQLTNLTSSEVSCSWTPAGDETSWDVLCVPQGTVVDDDAEWISVPETLATFSDLSAQTDYTIYVRANCGDEVSMAKTINFTTSCSAQDVPWSENFEQYDFGDFPACWTVINTNTYDYPYVTSRGMGYVMVSAGNTMFATPALTSNIEDLQMTFSLEREGDQSGTFEVGVMSNLFDPNSFELVQSFMPDQTGLIYNYTVNFSNVQNVGTDRYIVFRQVSTATNWYYWLDNVVVTPMPDCSAPSLTVSTVGMTEASVTWGDAHGTQFEWEIVYGLAGLNPNDSTPTNVFGETLFTMVDLTPNTSYDVYIRTLCSEEVSDWSAPITIRTLNALPADLPYSCDFTDTVENAAWTLLNGTCTNNWYIAQPAEETGNVMFVSNTGTTETYVSSNSAVWAYRDFTFGDASEFNVDIMWKALGEGTWDYLKIYIGSPSEVVAGYSIVPTGVVPLTTEVLNDHPSFTHLSAILNGSYANSTQRLYFLWKDDGSIEYSPAAVIKSVEIAPVFCSRPSNITVNNITTTSFDVTFQPGSEDDVDWEYAVVPAGSAITDADIVPINDINFSVLGLTPSTMYDVYVRTVCNDGGNSAWQMTTVSTECGFITIPFVENFDNIVASGSESAFPLCWNRFNTYSSSFQFPYVDNAYSTSGSSSLYFYASYATYCMAVLPPIDTTENAMNSLMVSFNMIQPSYIDGELQVGVMSDPENVNTFTVLESFTVSSTIFETKQLMLNNYTGNGNHIAFKMVNSNYAFYVDDITIDFLPNCLPPTNLDTVSVSETSAELTWTANGPATSWAVVYGTPGFDPETSGTQVVTNDVPFTLTGLTANTSYDVYVRSICSTSEMSAVSNVVSFTTDGVVPEECAVPTNVIASNILITEADINWTPGGNETSWKLQYKTETGSWSNDIAVSTRPYHLTNLTAETGYVVRVKAVCTDGESDWSNTYSFTTNPEVGIDNVELANSVSLMPNPADNYIEMTVNGNVNVKEAAIYNAFGQMIQTVQLTDNHARINLDNYASGMYFVRVAGDNAVATKKFIKK